MGQSIALRAQEMVRDAATPVSPGETVKAQMNRAARALGFPVGNWRIRAAWNGEADCWSAKAFKELEDAYAEWKAERERRKAASERNAAALKASAADFYSALAERLRGQDEAFHREEIAALVDLARRFGRNDADVNG